MLSPIDGSARRPLSGLDRIFSAVVDRVTVVPDWRGIRWVVLTRGVARVSSPSWRARAFARQIEELNAASFTWTSGMRRMDELKADRAVVPGRFVLSVIARRGTWLRSGRWDSRVLDTPRILGATGWQTL